MYQHPLLTHGHHYSINITVVLGSQHPLHLIILHLLFCGISGSLVLFNSKGYTLTDRPSTMSM